MTQGNKEQLLSVKELRTKIFKISEEEPSFLHNLNSILLNYDYAKDDAEKSKILDEAREYSDLCTEQDFFDNSLRPFLENVKSVSDFCMTTTDIAVKNLAQKRHLAK